LLDGAYPGVQAAFGIPGVTARNGNHGYHPGKGDRSLASVKCKHVQLYTDYGGHPRACLYDSTGAVWEGVPVNDLSFREHTPRCRRCSSLTRLGATIVRVGLTRPYAPAGGDPVCWLQVNGIFPIQDDWPHFYQEPVT
jgi:hypothetical protein